MSDHTMVLGRFLAESQRSFDDRSVDVHIDDPPYLAHTHDKQRRGGGKRGAQSSERAVGFDAITSDDRRLYAFEIARVTRRWAIVFSDAEGWQGWKDDLNAAGMIVVRQLVWVRGSLDLDEGQRAIRGRKGAPKFDGKYPAQGTEHLVLAHRVGVPMRWNGRGCDSNGRGGKHGGDNVYIHDIERDGRSHPTQKPLAFLRRLVCEFSDRGNIIADGFAGSGTTPLAAKIEGRRSWSCEVNETYAAAAARRLGLSL